MGLAIGVVTGVVSGAVAYLWQGNPCLGVALFVAMVDHHGDRGPAWAPRCRCS